MEARRKQLGDAKLIVDAGHNSPSSEAQEAPKTALASAETVSRTGAGFSFRRKPKPASASSATVAAQSLSPEAQTSLKRLQFEDDQARAHINLAETPALTGSLAQERKTSYLRISGKHNRHINMFDLLRMPSSQDAQERDLHLLDLTNSLVDLRPTVSPVAEASGVALPTFAAAQLRGLRRCILWLPPVSGAVMLHDVQDCLLRVECGQVSREAKSVYP